MFHSFKSLQLRTMAESHFTLVRASNTDSGSRIVLQPKPKRASKVQRTITPPMACARYPILFRRSSAFRDPHLMATAVQRQEDDASYQLLHTDKQEQSPPTASQHPWTPCQQSPILRRLLQSSLANDQAARSFPNP